MWVFRRGEQKVCKFGSHLRCWCPLRGIGAWCRCEDGSSGCRWRPNPPGLHNDLQNQNWIGYVPEGNWPIARDPAARKCTLLCISPISPSIWLSTVDISPLSILKKTKFGALYMRIDKTMKHWPAKGGVPLCCPRHRYHPREADVVRADHHGFCSKTYKSASISSRHLSFTLSQLLASLIPAQKLD